MAISRRWILRLMEHGLSTVEIAAFLEIPLVMLVEILKSRPGDVTIRTVGPGEGSA